MKAIIHNDDLGLTFGFTDAIGECFKSGITTSTCIRTNGTAYRYAVSHLKKKLNGIGLGLHLNITQGSEYRSGFVQYFIRCLLGDQKLLEKIENDFEAQFKIAEKDKLKFDHLNSQDHVHMIPAIFEIVCRLAKKHKIRYIRLCDENYYLTGDLWKDLQPFFNSNFIKFLTLKIMSTKNRKLLKKYGLKSSDNFYGVLHTNNMDEKAYLGALRSALRKNLSVVEILSHPVITHYKKDKIYLSDSLAHYANLANREIERKTMLSGKLKNFIRENGIDLVNYKNI